MPIFTVHCKCGKEYEHLDRSITNPKSAICPYCGLEGEKEIGLPNAHYKGKGFFTNDYKTAKQQEDRINYLGTPD